MTRGICVPNRPDKMTCAPGLDAARIAPANAINGFARMFAKIRSNGPAPAGNARRPGPAAVRIQGCTRLARAFASVVRVATGSRSVAQIGTPGHSFAAAMARMPEPVPRSRMARGRGPCASASSVDRQPGWFRGCRSRRPGRRRAQSRSTPPAAGRHAARSGRKSARRGPA